jgi:hypothetical protein
MSKVELGSPEWLRLAEQYLVDAIPALGDAVAEVRFSMCEAFTSAPARFADDAGRAAWWFAIEGPAVTLGAGYRDDVDIVADVDYEQALVGARTVYDTVAEPIDQPANAFEALPVEVRACLTGLHNFLAPQTA